jgi:hypothetical protein
MQTITVAVVNLADVSDGDIENGVEALQMQLDAHFAEAWHISAQLETLGPDEDRPHAWGLVLGHTIEQLRMLGYRDTTKHGLPLALVGVHNEQPWTYPASRQLLQMLANPYGRLAACGTAPPDPPDLVLLDVCAPVEDSGNIYVVQVSGDGEWPVSNFVYPSWFQPGGPRPYDYLRRVRGPREISALGGHLVFFDLAQQSWMVRTESASSGDASVSPMLASGSPAGSAGDVVPSRLSTHP